MIEIERKFLPSDTFRMEPKWTNKASISQVYVTKTGDEIWRVRQTTSMFGTSHILCYKRKIDAASCIEVETQISDVQYYTLANDREALLKDRYIMEERDGVIWTLDVFRSGKKKGQMLIEGELKHNSLDINAIELPHFVGVEVTDDPSWRNMNMLEYS